VQFREPAVLHKAFNLSIMSLTIDTHHHMLPEFFFEATNEKANPVGGLKPQAWSIEKSLAFMDEMEIDIAVMEIEMAVVRCELKLIVV